MVRPGLQWRKKNDRSALFPVLVDLSRSMTTKDGPGGIARFDGQLKALRENRALLEQLSKKVQKPDFGYDKELLPLAADAFADKPATPLEAKGDQTAIGFVLDSLLK